MQQLQQIIDDAFENRAALSPSDAPAAIREARIAGLGYPRALAFVVPHLAG